MKLFKSFTIPRALPWILIVCGSIGLLCAGIIMYEKVELLKNPDYSVPCNLDPIISCGSVMESEQASAFGFPNPFIGLMAFPVVITSGVIMLMGARLKRWYALGLNIGALGGVAFTHWLFYQSVWQINALCPWCIVVWVMTFIIFVYVTAYNLREGHLKLPAKLAGLSAFVQKHHLDIVLAWVLILFVLIMHHFWYYYGSKLGF
jgi:uncharacterized membrane protein